MLRDLGVLYHVGSLVGLTDRQLLERFQSAGSAGDHAAAEAALTAMVDRHAAMVWNVCRSLIRDPHDAEDAFQATFLILVRRAGSLHIDETLGPWLHVVAHRTALSMRTSVSRRRDVERSASTFLHEAIDPVHTDPASSPADELRASIHAEIMNLPEVFRSVVVLCDLEGLSYLEAAGRLKVPLGTVQSRLARARRRLRRSLTLRGIHPSDAGDDREKAGASILGSMMAGGLPPSLAGRVGRLGALIASDPARLKSAVAASVQVLIKGGLRSMLLGKLKPVLVASLAGVLIGGSLLYTDARSGQTEQEAAQPKSRLVEVKRPIETPAPRELRVASGHGKTLVYALDDTGDRIPARPEVKNGPFRETQREINWAVVTGLIDHHRVQKWFLTTHRQPLPRTEPLYRRVDLERQTLRKDGSWSDWGRLDMDAILGLLDNVPAIEEERVPPQYRPTALVDPLPFLTDGKWRGVDVEEFIPHEERTRVERPTDRARALDPWRDRPPVLMMRSFDFTVESGRTYRYRARLVLLNHGRQPNDPKTIAGPWSEATDIVTIASP